jgi:hypothetical protein
MKKFIALTLLLLLLLCATALPAYAGRTDTLSLQIRITRGERSKDSNASTIELSLSGRKLIYRTLPGRRMGGRAVAPREFQLTSDDERKLIKLIAERNLLRSDSIEREQEESGIYFYFGLSLKTVLNGKEGLIQLKGSRKANALKDEKLYQDAVALIEEIYRIMGRADSGIAYEALIN